MVKLPGGPLNYDEEGGAFQVACRGRKYDTGIDKLVSYLSVD